MLRNIIVALGILNFIFLMLIVSLVKGIEINNIWYNNININRLYIKYDKSLILQAQKVSIFNEIKTKHRDINITFKIDDIFDIYNVTIEKIALLESSLKFDGRIKINLEKVNFDEKLDLTIDDFIFAFDENLKSIKAKQCLMSFYEDKLYFKFKEPRYDGISLDNSEVSIQNISSDAILYLDLRTTDVLTKPLLDLLKYYKVNLPIKQEYGKNDIFTQIVIPFDEKPIKISSKIDIKDSKIIVFGTPITIDTAKIVLNDNKIVANAKVVNENIDSNLTYNILLTNHIDFSTKTSNGKFKINKFKNKAVELSKTIGNYDINFIKDFKADIFLEDNSSVYLNNEKYILNNFKTIYSNKHFYTNTEVVNDKYGLKLDIGDSFDINSLNSYGKFKINSLKGKAVELDQTVGNYNIDFINDFKTDISLENNSSVYLNDEKYILNNFKTFYADKYFYTNAQIVNNQYGLSLDINDTFNIDSFKSHGDLNLSYNYKNIVIDDKKIDYKIYHKNDIYLFNDNKNVKVKLAYKNKKLFSSGIITKVKNNIKINFNNIVEFEENRSFGDLNVTYKYNDIIKLDNVHLEYYLGYKDNILLSVPQVGLIYTQDDTIKSKRLTIDNVSNILTYIKGVSSISQNSKLVVDTNDFSELNISLENLNLDINNTVHKLDISNNKDKNNSNVNLHGINGNLKYGKYTVNYDKLDLSLSDNNMTMNVIDDSTNIKLTKQNNVLKIKSKYISSDYLNEFFNKKILEEGFIDIKSSIQNSTLIGTVNLHNTIIKDANSINNLITFIHATPAVANPILVIPTVFRLAQTGFDATGYYVKKGHVSFSYDYINDYIKLYDIFTKSTMVDFKASGDIDLRNDNMKIKTDVIFFKDYSKFLNYIPMVGYLVTGDNGNFMATVDINGSLDDPQFETHTIYDASQGIFNFIERVITLPVKIFE